jgi:hypothetical protein
MTRTPPDPVMPGARAALEDDAGSRLLPVSGLANLAN